MGGEGEGERGWMGASLSQAIPSKKYTCRVCSYSTYLRRSTHAASVRTPPTFEEIHMQRLLALHRFLDVLPPELEPPASPRGDPAIHRLAVTLVRSVLAVTCSALGEEDYCG
jgi:hypothetical protein